mgnify:CR=1 FL=1
MKLKNILKEHAYLGELPSSKLKKMKWNPVLSPNKVVKEKVEVDIKPAQTELVKYIIGWMKKNIK